MSTETSQKRLLQMFFFIVLKEKKLTSSIFKKKINKIKRLPIFNENKFHYQLKNYVPSG